MMPLSEIKRLVESVDHAGTSPAADAVAAAWGLRPGAAIYWRSSASHVFAVTDQADQDGAPRAYLRFVPAAHRARRQVETVAALVDRLRGRALPVAGVIPSAAGNLVETVHTALGEVHAMLVRSAEGDQVGVDDLTPSRASAWGAALGRLHHEGSQLAGIELPVAFAELDQAPAFADDPPLAAAVRRLTGRLTRLPRDPARFGVVHGDFELDNLAWRDGTATAYDFDEAAHSWFVADIAFAVRDLDVAAGGQPLFTAFLAGYRQSRPLDERDLAQLPLFTALHAASAIARLRPGVGRRHVRHRPWLARRPAQPPRPAPPAPARHRSRRVLGRYSLEPPPVAGVTLDTAAAASGMDVALHEHHPGRTISCT